MLTDFLTYSPFIDDPRNVCCWRPESRLNLIPNGRPSGDKSFDDMCDACLFDCIINTGGSIDILE